MHITRAVPNAWYNNSSDQEKYNKGVWILEPLAIPDPNNGSADVDFTSIRGDSTKERPFECIQIHQENDPATSRSRSPFSDPDLHHINYYSCFNSLIFQRESMGLTRCREQF
jgi:hypothetical protein